MARAQRVRVGHVPIAFSEFCKVYSGGEIGLLGIALGYERWVVNIPGRPAE